MKIYLVLGILLNTVPLFGTITIENGYTDKDIAVSLYFVQEKTPGDAKNRLFPCQAKVKLKPGKSLQCPQPFKPTDEKGKITGPYLDVEMLEMSRSIRRYSVKNGATYVVKEGPCTKGTPPVCKSIIEKK